MDRFPGTRVVVSGGAGGIGSRIAARFAGEGARVVVLDAKAAGATALDSGIVTALQVDVTQPNEVASAVDAVDAELGGIDVLVNAHGIHRLSAVTETTVDEWRQVMDVNALGTLLVMQEAGRRMLARGVRGRVINLSSMAAKQGGAREAAYAASKAAVVALTRVAALEWGPSGITVNAICPGYVPTDMGAASRSAADVARWTAMSPLGRLGTPDDVAGLTLFLASAEGAYMTGQAINVTGGMVM